MKTSTTKKWHITQRQFDKLLEAAKALDVQARRSIKGKEEFSCMYRSEGGLKCFVGHMIPDNCYDPAMEGMDASMIVDSLYSSDSPAPDTYSADELYEIFSGYDLDLLNNLQVYHDTSSKWQRQRISNPTACQDYLRSITEISG